MTEIKNRIILDDQMSAALAEIAENSRNAIEALGGFPIVTNEMIDSIMLAKEHALKFYEATGGSFSKFNEQIIEMYESFEKINEKLFVMTEKIENKAKAVDSVAESVGKVSKSSGDAVKGFKDMTDGALKIAQTFGLIPPEVAKGFSGVMQLSRGIAATIPKASSLAAMLGPVSLVSPAVMGIVNAASMFGRTVKDEIKDAVLPTFDELIRQSERHASESFRLTESLRENVELMERMKYLGADNSLLLYLESEGHRIQANIDFFRILALNRDEEARAAAMASMTALSGYGALFGTDGVYTLRGINNLQLLEKELESFIMTGAGRFIGLEEDLDTMIEQHVQYADVLRGTVDPVQMEFLARIDAAQDAFIGLHRVALNATDILSYNTQIMEDLEAQYAQSQAVIAATAAIHERTHQHILRAYRDTHAAAESLHAAHSSMVDAIYAVNNSYGMQLDTFNHIMNLSPEYLNFLFDEWGALKDIEDAIYDVTHAQIELMSSRQAHALLDAAQVWIDEAGTLSGFRTAIHSATDSVWGLVEARMADIKFAEKQRLLEMGMPYEWAANAAMDITRGLRQQIESIQGMMDSAHQGLLENGPMRPDTISTAAGRAMVVADPANWAIRNEIVRLKEDITTRQFASGAYQRGHVTVNLGGYSYSPNVYPTELSAASRREIAKEGGRYGAVMVAEMIEEACNNDLLRAYE